MSLVSLLVPSILSRPEYQTSEFTHFCLVLLLIFVLFCLSTYLSKKLLFTEQLRWNICMNVFDTYYRYVQLLYYPSGRNSLFLLICLVTHKAADNISPSKFLNHSDYKCMQKGTFPLAGTAWQTGGLINIPSVYLQGEVWICGQKWCFTHKCSEAEGSWLVFLPRILPQEHKERPTPAHRAALPAWLSACCMKCIPQPWSCTLPRYSRAEPALCRWFIAGEISQHTISIYLSRKI